MDRLILGIISKTIRVIFLQALIILCGCVHYGSPIPDAMVAIHIQDRNGLTETISMPEKLQNYENTDFLSSQPYKKVLRVYKREGKNHSVITTYHPNGSIAQYLEAKDMRAHGAYREWFASGQLKIEAWVIGGTADVTGGAQKDWLFDGICQVWNEQGNLLAKIPYEKGVLQGTSLYFYPSGQLQKQAPYVKNMEEGEEIDFYPNGIPKTKTHFSKGIKTGVCTGYFENGRQAWAEEYCENLLLNGTYYTLEGEQIATVDNGRGQQVRYEGNHVVLILEIRQGMPEGMVKKFTPKKELQACCQIKKGRRHGEEIEYYSFEETGEKEPRPKMSIQWDQDSIHGIVKTWYPNGQLKSQREYARNEKLGPSCAWYKNGSLMFVEEYEEGRLMKGAYYKKNQMEPISTIVNGNGLAYLYDEDGIFIKKVLYAKGKPSPTED